MLDCKEGRLLRQIKREDTTMKINILLCDDDKDFLQRLTEVVTSQPLPPGISACVTKSAHSSAITDRQLSQYQIMFLDIDMDERSGMDIARRVRELHLDTIIIFVTNYPEFSMEGYEVRAFRYLLKQELQQKLPLYFRDALAEIPHDKKELQDYKKETVTYNDKKMSLYEGTQYQRAIERKIRYWKRQAAAMEAAKLDSSAENAKILQWQKTMQDFVKQTGLDRQRVRETIIK